MKKFIRVLAMLMTLCMLVSVFAACSKNESVDTDAINTDAPAVDDQPAEEGEVIKVMNKDAFLILVKGINENPESSKGKTYKLMADIDLHSGWNSSPTEKLGQFVAPDAITAFAGISEFYGVFDGNGKTISGVYMSESAEAGDNVAFIRKLNGGTVKNLVINNAFVMDNGAKGATVSGLVGTVNGDNAVIENVTVNAGVYSATNAEATVAGIVGKVEAENLTVKDVTFGGKAGNVTESLSVNATSTAAVLAQIIADGGDKTIAMSGCKANGAILANDGATKDAFCAKGASKLTKTDCTITAPEGDGGVEDTLVNIYTAEEFKYLAAANSTFAGKTIKLMKSIDLNPEWEASTVAPANVWTPIASFAGTFDGNGQTISGIYGESFITALNGGTVKNLLVLNSVFVSDSAANVGFIGPVNGGNVSVSVTDDYLARSRVTLGIGISDKFSTVFFTQDRAKLFSITDNSLGRLLGINYAVVDNRKSIGNRFLSTVGSFGAAVSIRRTTAQTLTYGNQYEQCGKKSLEQRILHDFILRYIKPLRLRK